MSPPEAEDDSYSLKEGETITVADSFSYKVNDGVLESETATVSFQIEPVNDPPEAKDDNYEVDEGETLEVDVADGVLANDEDAEEDSLIVFLVEGPKHGSLTLDIDGSFVYDHDGSEAATDSFVYRSFDGIDESEDATVCIQVSGKNDRPVIDSCEKLRIPEKPDSRDQAVLFTSDRHRTTNTRMILPLIYTTGKTTPFQGAWLIPAADFTGDLLVTVTVTDGELESETFTATVTVTGVVNVDAKGCSDDVVCKTTISEAISHAKSGKAEIVQVLEGDYEENVVLDADILMEIGVSKEFRFVPAGNPTVIGNGAEGPSMVIEDGTAVFYNGVLQ